MREFTSSSSVDARRGAAPQNGEGGDWEALECGKYQLLPRRPSRLLARGRGRVDKEDGERGEGKCSEGESGGGEV